MAFSTVLIYRRGKREKKDTGNGSTRFLRTQEKRKETAIMTRKKWFQKSTALLLVTAFVLAGQTNYRVVSAAVPEKAQAQPAEKEKPENQIIGKTETATIYDLGEGKKKAEIYPHKVRYRDGDELVNYDTALKKIKKKKTEAGTDLTRYAYGTSRGRTPVYLPETLTGETPVFTENGDYQVQLVPITPEIWLSRWVSNTRNQVH